MPGWLNESMNTCDTVTFMYDKHGDFQRKRTTEGQSSKTSKRSRSSPGSCTMNGIVPLDMKYGKTNTVL